MIMIIAIIYIFFLFYVIFDQELKITFGKSSSPPWKNPLSPFYSLPPKNLKIASPPLFINIENFLGPPSRKGGTLCCIEMKLITDCIWRSHFHDPKSEIFVWDHLFSTIEKFHEKLTFLFP